MCEAARDRGRQGDPALGYGRRRSSFGGYRKHLACVSWPARYGRLCLRAPARAVRPGRSRPRCRWRQAAAGCAIRAGPSDSSPSRNCRRNRGSGAATPSTTRPGARGRAPQPGPAPTTWTTSSDEHRCRSTPTTTLDDQVNRMCLADSRLFLPGLNLAYTDRASMAASVEVRVPFVDPVVARAAFTIPGRDKIRGRQTARWCSSEAAERWLPARDNQPAQGVVQRPPAGLGARRPARDDRRPARARRARLRLGLLEAALARL